MGSFGTGNWQLTTGNSPQWVRFVQDSEWAISTYLVFKDPAASERAADSHTIS
jgi:hypothetical protein